jgi:hypothetical protein
MERRFEEEVLIEEARWLRRRRWIVGSIVSALIGALIIVVVTSAGGSVAKRTPARSLSLPGTATKLATTDSTRCRNGSGVDLSGFGSEGLFGASVPGGGAVVGYQAEGLQYNGSQQAPVILEGLTAGCTPNTRFGHAGRMALQIPFPNSRRVRGEVGGEVFMTAMTATAQGDVLVFGNYGHEIIGAEVNRRGKLVGGFGARGWVAIDNPKTSDFLSNVASVVSESDGSILIGVDDVLGGQPSLVYELGRTGRLITTFGSDGFARVLPRDAELTQIINLPGGSIVVVGWLQILVDRGRTVFVALSRRGREENGVTANLVHTFAWLPANNLNQAVAYGNAFGGINIVGWGTVVPPWNRTHQAMPPHRAPMFGYRDALSANGEPVDVAAERLLAPPPDLGAFQSPLDLTLLSTVLPDGVAVVGDTPNSRARPSFVLHHAATSGVAGVQFTARDSRTIRSPQHDLDGGFGAVVLFPGPRDFVDVAVAEPTSVRLFEVAV